MPSATGGQALVAVPRSTGPGARGERAARSAGRGPGGRAKHHTAWRSVPSLPSHTIYSLCGHTRTQRCPYLRPSTRCFLPLGNELFSSGNAAQGQRLSGWLPCEGRSGFASRPKKAKDTQKARMGSPALCDLFCKR